MKEKVELPEDWKIARLEEVCEKIKSGGTPLTSRKEYYGGKIPFVKIEDITNAGKYLSDTNIYITEEGLNSSNAWWVPENSILLAIYGSIGSMAINKIPVSTNQAILGIIPNEKAITEYLYYSLTHSKNRMLRQRKQSTQANLTAKIVKDFKLPLPPLPEQRKIAEILSSVDSAIQQVDEAIARTERLKKGLMQELLSRGIGHSEFKETEIGRIPEEWGVVRLGEIGDVRKEMITPEGGGISYVGLEHIEPGKTRLNQKGDSSEVRSSKFVFHIGDILYGKLRPYLDKAVVSDTSGICSTDILVITPKKEKTISEFLIYIIHSKRFLDYSISAMKGTNHPRTSWKSLSKFKLPLPPLSEQKKIAEILSAVDEKIALEKERKAKLERVKKGLMNDLLIGKKRVKADGGDLR